MPIKILYSLVGALLCLHLNATAQDTLGEVVVTATRTLRLLKSVPVPVTVIAQDKIERIGALRLNEVLAEQAGLQIITDHGTGIQLQGLSADYILILIDGEPVIGRTAGTLDLSRLAVGNIQRIEIVKGPSSSLYGSEAMGGVINIITRKNTNDFSGNLRARLRRNNTLDASAEASKQYKNWGWYLFANRMHTDGYYTTDSISKAIPALTAYTLNPKLQVNISRSIAFSLNTRLYTERQHNYFGVTESGALKLLRDASRINDVNISPTLTFKPNMQSRLQVRHYITIYSNDNKIHYDSDKQLYDASDFKQVFNRSEAQYDHHFSEQHISTLGLGNIIETVNATRYDNNNRLSQQYVFAQHQWIPLKQFNLMAGFRYDKHNQYSNRFSPKLALRWNINRWISLQASAGGGYKAPDFRQLLLNFTNPIAGYSVFGTSVVGNGIAELQAQNQISSLYIDPKSVQAIKAESSVAYNISALLTPNQQTNVQVNLFRNDIKDLIDTRPVALKANGQNVFSYFNYNKVFTQGVELQAGYTLPVALQVSAGYQYLDAKDATVWDQIKDGKVYYRDPTTNLDKKVKRQDYGGLYNRSKHAGNIKLLYDNKRYDFNVSVRGIYRGRFGYGGDLNANNMLDDDREYADAYTVWNLSAQKLLKAFTFEAGVNNMFNAKNTYDPLLAGVQWYVGAGIRFTKKGNTQTTIK